MGNSIPTISVDFNKSCRKCGKRGACQNGYCLACNAEKLKRGKGTPMDNTVKDGTLKAAKAEAGAMLTEHWSEIQEAFSEAYSDFCQQKDSGLLSDKAKFKYPIALKVVQEPVGGDVRVKAMISWGVTHKDESEGKVVSSHPELPMDE